jgi:hypothetical protein
MRRAAVFLVLLAGPAFAQGPVPSTLQPHTPPVVSGGRVWTEAPRNTALSDDVSPADRAGGRTPDAGPSSSTPFSGTPVGSGSRGGQISPADRGTLQGSDTALPNLSK